MRIWIFIPGEPAVFHPDVAGVKPMRMALLGQTLARRGHEVIWWTGAFQHQTKVQLEPAGRLLETREPGLSLYLLPSPGYERNLSLARFRDYAAMARNWRKAVEGMEPPDVIVASWPPVDTAHAAVEYGRRHNIPVIVDVRDMWPDIIYDRLREKLHLPFMPRFLRGYERMAGETFADATGIIGITDKFVDWGLRYARRERRETDAAFFLTSPPLVGLSPDEREKADAFWRSKGVEWDDSRVIFVWVGTLLDDPVSRLVLRVLSDMPEETEKRMRFVICGKGTLEGQISTLADEHAHVTYAGFIDRAPLVRLLEHASYGMLPYARSPDFEASIPNKVNEYLGAGVSVFTTLTGEIRRVLDPFGVACFTDPEPDALRATFARLVAAGPATPDQRRKARACYDRLFASDVVYGAMAEHLEAL